MQSLQGQKDLTKKSDFNQTFTFMFQHVHFVNRVSYGYPPNEAITGRSQNTPALSSAFQRYYYDKGRHREDLLKSE